jgi:hypothetical protein
MANSENVTRTRSGAHVAMSEVSSRCSTGERVFPFLRKLIHLHLLGYLHTYKLLSELWSMTCQTLAQIWNSLTIFANHRDLTVAVDTVKSKCTPWCQHERNETSSTGRKRPRCKMRNDTYLQRIRRRKHADFAIKVFAQ